MVGNPPTCKDYIITHSTGSISLTPDPHRNSQKGLVFWLFLVTWTLSEILFKIPDPSLVSRVQNYGTTYKSFHMELLAGDNNSIVLVDDIFSFTIGFESMVTGREIKPSTVCLIAEHGSPELSKFKSHTQISWVYWVLSTLCWVSRQPTELGLHESCKQLILLAHSNCWLVPTKTCSLVCRLPPCLLEVEK